MTADVRSEHTSGDRPLCWAAIGVAAGALASGPLGLFATFIDPQPTWTDTATFTVHFRPWHQTPFWFGFAFIAAWVALNARLAAMAFERRPTRALALLVATAIYGAMIALNYAIQVAFVPALVATRDQALAYFAMANPASLAWAIEMFGYGVLGAANALSADFFPGRSRRRTWIAGLMLVNTAIGIAGAAITAANLRWVVTPIGLGAYFGWNAVVILMAGLIATEYWPRNINHNKGQQNGET